VQWDVITYGRGDSRTIHRGKEQGDKHGWYVKAYAMKNWHFDHWHNDKNKKEFTPKLIAKVRSLANRNHAKVGSERFDDGWFYYKVATKKAAEVFAKDIERNTDLYDVTIEPVTVVGGGHPID